LEPGVEEDKTGMELERSGGRGVLWRWCKRGRCR